MISNLVATLMVASFITALGPQAQRRPATDASQRVTVYRVKTCGCCGKWAEHLKAAGFDVAIKVVDDVARVEGRNRVPEKLRTCHVAFVGPYVVEGHVPADVIKDLLRRRPAIDGIAVPGMPKGSPGMESPTPQPYEVIAFDKKVRRRHSPGGNAAVGKGAGRVIANGIPWAIPALCGHRVLADSESASETTPRRCYPHAGARGHHRSQRPLQRAP